MQQDDYSHAIRAGQSLVSFAWVNYYLGALILLGVFAGAVLYAGNDRGGVTAFDIGVILFGGSIGMLWFVIGTLVAGAGQALLALIAIAVDTRNILNRLPLDKET